MGYRNRDVWDEDDVRDADALIIINAKYTVIN